ncbi:MAG: hypothetical protein ACR65R_16250 [Methylomicrobium sp.]
MLSERLKAVVTYSGELSIAFSRRLSKEQCMIDMRCVEIESQSLNRLVDH